MYVIEDGMLVRIENAIKPNMDNAYYNLNTYHQVMQNLLNYLRAR